MKQKTFRRFLSVILSLSILLSFFAVQGSALNPGSALSLPFHDDCGDLSTWEQVQYAKGGETNAAVEALNETNNAITKTGNGAFLTPEHGKSSVQQVSGSFQVSGITDGSWRNGLEIWAWYKENPSVTLEGGAKAYDRKYFMIVYDKSTSSLSARGYMHIYGYHGDNSDATATTVQAIWVNQFYGSLSAQTTDTIEYTLKYLSETQCSLTINVAGSSTSVTWVFDQSSNRSSGLYGPDGQGGYNTKQSAQPQVDFSDGKFAFACSGTLKLDDITVYANDEEIAAQYQTDYANVLELNDTDVTLENAAQIEAAYNAYLLLTSEQQAFLTNEAAKLEALLQAADDLLVPRREDESLPLVEDFEDDLSLWRSVGTAEWEIIENPKKSTLNTSDYVLKAPDYMRGFITLHRNLWPLEADFVGVSGKFYSPTANDGSWMRVLSICYWYKDQNNYKRIDIILYRDPNKPEEPRRYSYRTYMVMDGYVSLQGNNTSNSIWLNAGNFKMTATEAEWMDWSIEYAVDTCKFTLKDSQGNTDTINIHQKNANVYRSIYKSDDLNNKVEEPIVNLSGDKFALAQLQGSNYFDDITVTFGESSKGVAKAFTDKYAQLLVRTPDSLSLDADGALVHAAWDEFNAMRLDAQLLLTDEKEKLKALYRRIDDLEIAKKYNIDFPVDLNDGITEDFENGSDRWIIAESEKTSEPQKFEVVEDTLIPGNHCLELTSSGTSPSVAEYRDLFWPKKASKKLVTFKFRLNGGTKDVDVFHGTRLYYDYNDALNWKAIMIYRDNANGPYFYRWEEMTDGSFYCENGTNLKGSDLTQWTTMQISYSNLYCNITLIDSAGAEISIGSKRVISSIKGRFALASGGRSATAWYDDILISFIPGDWDEDIAVSKPYVYYKGNTWIKPGETAYIYGDDLYKNITGVKLLRLNDVRSADTLDPAYITQPSFDSMGLPADELPASLPSWDESAAQWVEIAQATEDSIKFVIPETMENGIFAVKLYAKSGSADDIILYLNQPSTSFTIGDEGETATIGGWVRLVGSNLVALKNDTDLSDAATSSGAEQIADYGVYMKLISAADGTVYTLPVTQVHSKYSLQAQIPDGFPYGDYAVMVYNGFGDSTAWSKPSKIKIGTSPLAQRSSAVFNVLSYGAIGDGEANDTPAVVRALEDAALNPNGGTIYFPEGIYHLCSELWIPDNVKLVGDGYQKTIVMWTPDQWDWYELPDGMLKVHSNVEIEGIGFYGSRVGHFMRSYGSDCENLYFKNCRLYLYPFSGYVTGAPGSVQSTGQMTSTEMYAMVYAEVQNMTYSFYLKGKNIQITDNEIESYGRTFSSPEGERSKYYVVARNNIDSYYWAPITADLALIEYNYMYEMCLGELADGAYISHNQFDTQRRNNREIYTTDGGMPRTNGIVKYIDDVTYEFVDNAAYNKNSLVGYCFYAMTGQGYGQMRRIVANEGKRITLDEPFQIPLNRNTRIGLQAARTNMFFVGNDVYNGNAFGTYGTMVNSVFAQNKIHRTLGQDMRAYGGLNWFLSIVDTHYYDGFFFHGIGSTINGTDETGFGALRLIATATENYSIGFVVRGNLFEDNYALSVSSRTYKGLQDTVIESNTFRNSDTAIKVDYYQNIVTSADGLFINNNIFEDVRVQASQKVFSLAASKNKVNDARLVIYGGTLLSGKPLGDVNGDGKVSLKDSTLIKYYLAGKIEFSEEQKTAADFDRDGKISLKDSTAIQNCL